MVAMVLDAVTATRNLPHELGLSGCILADAEEACLGLVAVEQFQNPGRHCRIGTVIESERNLSATRGGGGQAHQVRAQ